jgi:hypothetical protein
MSDIDRVLCGYIYNTTNSINICLTKKNIRVCDLKIDLVGTKTK